MANVGHLLCIAVVQGDPSVAPLHHASASLSTRCFGEPFASLQPLLLSVVRRAPLAVDGATDCVLCSDRLARRFAGLHPPALPRTTDPCAVSLASASSRRRAPAAASIYDARGPFALLRSGCVESTVVMLRPLPRSTSSSSTRNCQVPLRTDISKYHDDMSTTTIDVHSAKYPSDPQVPR